LAQVCAEGIRDSLALVMTRGERIALRPVAGTRGDPAMWVQLGGAAER
jgi:hypothetical protein